MVNELKRPECLGSLRTALKLVGLSRSTWHYRQHPRKPVDTPISQSDRAYESQINITDRAAIAGLIQTAWAAGESVDHAFATAWDAGVMLASRRSWWRIASELDQDNRPVARIKATGPPRKRVTPVVVANGPGQVWSWDITELKSPYARKTFKAYSVIDIYSRMIIAWRVEDREDKGVVNEMFNQAIDAYGAPKVVHSDNGAVMKSNDLETLLGEHGVQMSHNRPYVSNDNPYSESEFYHHEIPAELSGHLRFTGGCAWVPAVVCALVQHLSQAFRGCVVQSPGRVRRVVGGQAPGAG